jgi:hypothetical protein
MIERTYTTQTEENTMNEYEVMIEEMVKNADVTKTSPEALAKSFLRVVNTDSDHIDDIFDIAGMPDYDDVYDETDGDIGDALPKYLEAIFAKCLNVPTAENSSVIIDEAPSKPDNNDIVKLWLVVEEDEKIWGTSVCSCHVTKTDAESTCNDTNQFVDWVSISWSKLESLNPNK